MRNLKHLYEKGNEKAWLTIYMREAKQRKSKNTKEEKIDLGKNFSVRNLNFRFLVRRRFLK